MRSYLFAPGTDERVVPKALASDADVVVLDLEDAIAPGKQSAGRQVMSRHASEISGRPTHIRIGLTEKGFALADVELARRLGVTTLRLPKAETAQMLQPVVDALDGDSGIRLHLTIESALGLSNAPEMASSPGVERFVFGERDFLADLRVDEPGPLTQHARVQLALLSRAAGLLPPIDGAYIHLDDPEGLRRSAEQARSYGFWGKSAIHPVQLPAIHGAFSHSPEEVEWAKRVTQAHEDALADGKAVSTVEGTFVDAAVVRRATEILSEQSR